MIDVDTFVRDGFVVVREAVPRHVAVECERQLLRDVGIDPADRSTWAQPVVRVMGRGGGPFAEAAMAERLGAATDAVVGTGRWVERKGIGTFPIRVPHPDEPGDDGWHIDASLPPDDDPTSTDYSRWGVNARSDRRALLWLMLFSEVGRDDAPTRLKVGSHLDVARHVAPGGDACTSPYPLPDLDHLPIALATGEPGDVYLLHPFTVHAAQRHRGERPRVVAQPDVAWVDSPEARPDPGRPEAERCAVEEAIARALA